MTGQRTSARAVLVRRCGLVVLAALVILGSVAPHGAGIARAAGIPPAQSGMGATLVTWNSASVASANDFASAMTISFNQPVDVRYYWNTSGAPVTVGTARLQMFYFGVALSTRDVVEQNPTPSQSGTIDMSWDPGVLRYVLEGTYLVTASLLSPSGATLWSENFWVHESAPYAVLAVIPIILILIGVYELYSVAISGRYIKRAKTSTPSPSETPSGTAPGTTDAGGSPPPNGSPPKGGS